MMQAVGPYALPFRQADVGPDYATNLATGYCNQRKLSIFGGSNEIQKNIISQMIMGL
jgi:alkylation response protein AidB-like acyl-CoA dehydrogenase